MATTVRRVTTRPYAVPEAGGGGGGGRVTLEPGTVTVVPVYSIHNDRRYFDHPETFRPHRFPEQLSSAYMPHGSGPRSYISKGPFLSHLYRSPSPANHTDNPASSSRGFDMALSEAVFGTFRFLGRESRRPDLTSNDACQGYL